MAKFKCNICGQTFEADSKPDKCPICGADASVIVEVEEPQAEGTVKPKKNKKGFNTNGNAYTIIYSVIIVVIVAFLLAFVVSALGPQQEANVKIDTMQHKLNALNIRGLDKSVVEEKFNDLKIGEDTLGDVLVEEFAIDGSTKYLVPVSGRGLWGGIWGYIALDDDLNTIYGTDFQHESETAGLGALIAEQPFQDSFRGKKVYAEGATEVTLSVVKKGKQGNLAPENYVDGITGATLTSTGVDAMLKECLAKILSSQIQLLSEIDGKCDGHHEGCKEHKDKCDGKCDGNHEGCNEHKDKCEGKCDGNHEGCKEHKDKCDGKCEGNHEGCKEHSGKCQHKQEAETQCADHVEGQPCTNPEPCDKCKQQMGK